jgi:hypothetical protein
MKTLLIKGLLIDTAIPCDPKRKISDVLYAHFIM